MNIITRLSERRRSEDMRIVIFAMLIYGVYLLLRYLFRTLAGQPKNSAPPQNKPGRKIDPDNIEDAEFEEIKKDK